MWLSSVFFITSELVCVCTPEGVTGPPCQGYDMTVIIKSNFMPPTEHSLPECSDNSRGGAWGSLVVEGKRSPTRCLIDLSYTLKKALEGVLGSRENVLKGFRSSLWVVQIAVEQ